MSFGVFSQQIAIRGFNPLLSSCVQAIDCEHVVLSGSNITQMQDFSGFGRNRAPSSGTIAITNNWRAGKAAWQSSAAGMLDQATYNLPQPYTMVIVGQWPASATTRAILYQSTATQAATTYQLATSGQVNTYAGTEVRVTSPSTAFVNRPFISVVTIGGDFREDLWFDGTAARYGSSQGSGAFALGQGVWGQEWNATNRWNAPLAAQFIYNGALTSNQRTYLLNGLSERYNIVPTGTQAYALWLGGDVHVSMGDYTAYDYNTPFSWSGWFKRLAAPGSWNAVVSKQQSSGSYRGWTVSYLSDRWVFQMQNTANTAYNRIYVMGAPPLNTWQHYAVTYAGSGGTSGMKIYLDGALQASSVTSNTLGSNTILAPGNILCVGRTNGVIDASNGLHSNVANFNYELTAGEVSSLYTAGRHADLSAFPGITNYWRLDNNTEVLSMANSMSPSGTGTPSIRINYQED